VAIADLLPEVAGLDALTQRIAALFAILQAKVGPEGSFRISSKCIAWAVGFTADPLECWFRVQRLERMGMLRTLERGKGYLATRYRWIGGRAGRPAIHRIRVRHDGG
jgi:hypothetical protein